MAAAGNQASAGKKKNMSTMIYYGFNRIVGSSYNPGNEDYPAVPYSRSGRRMRWKCLDKIFVE